MRVIILGTTGMLGHAVFSLLTKTSSLEVFGTTRSAAGPETDRILPEIDVLNADDLTRVFETIRPNVVVNAIGLVKQLAEANDPLAAVPINTLLPHRLARLCGMARARLIHVSTDCIFSGARGNYTEDDHADATDLYGTSKRLGEVGGASALTLRTSIIGRELRTQHGLVEWFLNAPAEVSGYRKAVFSGITTVEFAKLLRDHVLARPDLSGIYNVSADPINKYDLLVRLNEIYGLGKRINPDDRLVIDRSLDSARFRAATGYAPPPWDAMLTEMRAMQG